MSILQTLNRFTCVRKVLRALFSQCSCRKLSNTHHLLLHRRSLAMYNPCFGIIQLLYWTCIKKNTADYHYHLSRFYMYLSKNCYKNSLRLKACPYRHIKTIKRLESPFQSSCIAIFNCSRFYPGYDNL